ncbi:MAG: hypothetical protein OSA81_04530 [Longimicrobiales bacterium]|nr:hypothetical protein [Longimicrobiales bacterium]
MLFASTLKELDAQVMNGPMEVLGGDLVAQCMDPKDTMLVAHSVVAG